MSKKESRFMIKKSIESFLMALEIFNKPTIDYRLEGCVFFLCNSWELLLKAKLLKDGKSIFYSNSDRTISLNDAAAKIMTNEKDPVRINLGIVSSLRNTATHYIIPEFESEYVPFLAMCVKSYASKLYEYHGINITDYIKTDFLSLFTNNTTNKDVNILSKYGKDINDTFLSRTSDLANLLQENEDKEIAIGVQVNLVRINNKSKADFTYYSSNKKTDQQIKTIVKPVNPNETHKYNHHKIVNEIDGIIKKDNIKFEPIRTPIPTEKNPTPNIFTTACFDILTRKYNLKENEEYCVKIENGKSIVYKYSHKLVTAIITMILDDKGIVKKAKIKS